MKNLPVVVRLAALLAITAQPALAQDLDPVSDMIDTVIDAVTGPIGRGIAVLALVGAGVMMFFGRLNWPIFLAIFVGVVLVFSAETIVDGFGAAAD
ncbi:type IV secretion system protein VirB2 [Palleronia aestuarii]|uniref:Type IV secretion system protein VirB2 n=1 Tax=Palleronia aestuarii TaxID=568105 RepID=A0A2W7MY09_9RHOB|nr:TrbC/VirB2 family protein [Palleronia aestuarii]PZX12443.1 type IV secretion system protein VirB2 [Palleronia aestuarii]